MSNLIDKEGNVIPHNSLITWFVWDSDDSTTWQFFGVVKDYTQLSPPFRANKQCVVYLGGGLDFGSGVGQECSFKEVWEESEGNDEDFRGIKCLAHAREVSKILKKEFEF